MGNDEVVKLKLLPYLCAKINPIIKQAKEGERIEAVLGLYENGVPVSVIAKSLKTTEQQVL